MSGEIKLNTPVGGSLTLNIDNTLATDETLNISSPSFPGTVLKPVQPIISGQVGSFSDPTGPALIPFDDFWVSQGITYNATTKRFTVPVAGIYRITFNPFFKINVSPGRVLVGVNTDAPTNTTHKGHAYRNSNNYETGCIDSIVQLQANDYIVFYMHTGAIYNQTGDRFNQFSIELIG